MRRSIDDLKRSRFLTKKDIERPVLVTISASKVMNVAMEGAEPDETDVLYFKEFDKPFVLNSTNGQIIATIIGSKFYDDWIGHQIVLYIDPNVSFGGKILGGIRCRPPKNQTQPAPKPQTFDRSKSIENLRAQQKAAGLPPALRYDEQGNIIPENEPDPSIIEEPGADDEV